MDTVAQSLVPENFVDFSESTALELVLSNLAGTPDPRRKKLFEGLFRHLFAFIAEERPTNAEWRAALDFIKRTGQMSTDVRDEVGLIDGLIGTEMFVDLSSNRRPDAATPNSVLGPFYNPHAPVLPYLADITGEAAGERVVLHGRVLSLTGEPIGGATVDVWQTDEDGKYDAQLADPELNLRGRFTTGPDGEYACITVRAQHYDVPTDGTGGELLRAMGRHASRPGHIHIQVDAPGYDHLTTAIYPAGDPLLAHDAGFGVRAALIAPYVAADERDAQRFERALPFTTMTFDFRLVPLTAAVG